MSKIKLTADSGGGSVTLKAPATTTSNAEIEITVPDVATGSSLVTADSDAHLLLGGTADVNEITESSSNVGMVIGNTSIGNGGIAIINSTTGAGRIYFGDATGSDAARNRGQVNYYHNGDYMMFATAGSERLRIKSTGHVELASGNLEFANGAGIDFSNKTGGAAGTTSNQLSDYEEGTFTPGVTGTTGAGTPAYSAQHGYYIKIGKQVTCWVDLTVSSWSGASGDQQISGFPYTKDAQTGYYYSGTTNWYVDTNMGGTAVYTGYFADGSSTLNMFYGSTWANIDKCNVNVTGRTSFMITYTTD